MELTNIDIEGLVDMDENTRDILTSLQQSLTSISKDVNYLSKEMDEIKQCYVTKTEFSPVKMVTYGLVGSVLLGVLVALLGLLKLR